MSRRLPVRHRRIKHMVLVHTGNGHASSPASSKVRLFTTTLINIGNAITYTANTSNEGNKFVINIPGVYVMTYADRNSAGTLTIGIVKNSSDVTATPDAQAASELLAYTISVSGSHGAVTVVAELSTGDIIRAQTNGSADDTGINTRFMIALVRAKEF